MFRDPIILSETAKQGYTAVFVVGKEGGGDGIHRYVILN